jgi:S-adenosylmethionine decarboxylase
VYAEDMGHTSRRELWPVYINKDDDGRKDHFVRMDDEVYAGTHLIIDLWDVKRIDDLALMEKTMREAVDAAGATLLHIHLHHFTPNGGISGVAVLAESHISVHTWPERSFAAFDIFMCGNARPEKGLEVIKRVYSPGRVEVSRYVRGRVAENGKIS